MTHDKKSRFLLAFCDLADFAARPNIDFLFVVYENGKKAQIGRCRVKKDNILKVDWDKFSSTTFTPDSGTRDGFVMAVIINPSEIPFNIGTPVFEYLQELSYQREQT